MGGLRRREEGTIAVAYGLPGLDSVAGIRRLLDILVTDRIGLEIVGREAAADPKHGASPSRYGSRVLRRRSASASMIRMQPHDLLKSPSRSAMLICPRE
jgi:hypothetical protein